MNVNLKAKPFYLEDEQIKWVTDTLAGMSEDEKIRHLFCLVAYNDDDDYCRYIARDVRPGGFMSRVMPAEQCISTLKKMQHYAKIPMLVAANLEAGWQWNGNGGYAPWQAHADRRNGRA